ncbi:ethanolamine ammonia-lyase subunit EutC [Nocardia sp. CDC153]|uniref:ethanolamine ammonia-lyase subunit EutC n=1 Tax=Nocardia sp. CDC153 TaxID=3112167 RepID=UPI002DBC4DB8|nr:ethanolamine ammonia-lyase subunit EutC [Nocardia sp. CDC153]MEC3953907.1 ethanolamine ammonia-lyase subunit EutC [Nocardia sp. CDC153]
MTATPRPLRRPEDAAAQAFWDSLRRTTQARIGLGRAGDALPTTEVLEFRAAHAAARDAVHNPLDVAALATGVSALGLGEPVHVRSLAADRSEYLRRPDLGRLPGSVEAAGPVRLEAANSIAGRTVWSGTPPTPTTAAGAGDSDVLAGVPNVGAEVGFVLADGLSPRALADHGVPMLAALIETLGERYTLAPPVIATQARVALGDHIGAALGVTTVLVLIGERPGLSVADSLGIYLTHHPRPGRADSERNCISNIHPPEGLDYARAARIATSLVDGARRLGRSGVDLKDTSADPALTAARGEPLLLDAVTGPVDAHTARPALTLDVIDRA